MYMGRITTLRVRVETKRMLDEVKVHPRETYEDVIKRLIEIYKQQLRK